MKDIKDIENLSLAQLEEISRDTRIEVPTDLEASVHKAIAVRNLRIKRVTFGSIAASVAVAAMIGIFYLAKPHTDLYAEPKDTFDDPVLAYAALESAFNRIGTSVSEGMSSTLVLEENIEKATKVFK